MCAIVGILWRTPRNNEANAAESRGFRHAITRRPPRFMERAKKLISSFSTPILDFANASMNHPKGIKLPKKRKCYVISEDCKKRKKTEIVTVVNDVMAEKNKAKIVAGLLYILRLPAIDSVGTFLWANAPTPRAPQCVWRALLFPHPLFNLNFRQSLLPQLFSNTGQSLTLLGELLRRSHRWDLLHEWS